MTRDELLDKLNMLRFFNERAGRELWQDKPTTVQNKDIENADKALGEAIEMLTPKKPIRCGHLVWKYDTWCVLDEDEFWKCPSSEHHQSADVPLIFGQKYCHECAQKIDWDGIKE